MQNQKKDLYSTLNQMFELEKIISSEKKQFGDKDVIEYNRLLRSVENLKIDDIIEYHKDVLRADKWLLIEKERYEIGRAHV